MSGRPRVVVIGAGFAGSAIARALERVAAVTLIEAKSYVDLNPVLPRALVDERVAPLMMPDHREYLTNTYIIVGRVEEVRQEGVKVANRAELVAYDYLVIATGFSYGPWKAQEATPEERLATLRTYREQLRGAARVLIVGGRSTGCEIAGELLNADPSKSITIVHSGPALIDDLANEKASAHAAKFFAARNVKVILNDKVEGVSPGLVAGAAEYRTAGGATVAADAMVVAVGGGRANSGFMQAHFAQALDADGRVRVEPSLRVAGSLNMFAVGDVCDFPDGKKGVYAAMLHVKTCVANVRALIAKGPAAKLKAHKAAPAGGVVTFGPKDGVLAFPKFTSTGWLPSKIKGKDMFLKQFRKALGMSTPRV